MSISITSFLFSIISSNVFILSICLVIICTSKTLYIDPHYIWLCIVLILIRSLLPYEFFYTITVTSKTILPGLLTAAQFRLPYISICIINLLVLVWVTGALIKLVKAVYVQYKAEQFIRYLPDSKYMPVLQQILNQKKIKKIIRLVEIPGIGTPSLIGIKNPYIIIPDNLLEKDLKYILLHELEHYQCKDLYFIAILQIICNVYWWNPLFCVLKANAQKVIELRVDSNVSKALNEEQKIDYLQSLLNVARARNKNPNIIKDVFSVGFYEKQTDLDRRINNVLNVSRVSRKYMGRWLPRLAMLLVFLSTSIIVEPYAIRVEDEKGTFNSLNSSYIREMNGCYEWYINGKCLRLEQINGLEEIPIYKSEEDIK